MKKRRLGLGLAAGLISLLPTIARAEDFFIGFELFRGSGDFEELGSVSGNFVSMYPLARFRSPVGKRSEETTLDFQKELATVYRLGAVTGLGGSSLVWDETMAGVPGLLMLNEKTFRLEIRPKFLPPDKMNLRVLISRPSPRSRAPEKILDVDLVTTLDDPVVAGFAYDNQSYFLSLRVSKNAAQARDKDLRGARKPADISRIPLPVRRVPPDYPSGPEAEKFEGEVILRVTVDKDGRVSDVQVLQPLDPVVDLATARALRQWTFEADTAKNSDRPVSFAISFQYRKGAAWNFGSADDPVPSTIQAAPPAAGELDRILAMAAEYCRKLSAAVLDFVCEEKIAEEIYNYVFDSTPDALRTTTKRRIEKNAFLYDYQMIRTEAGVREDRTLLEDNGRKTKEPHAALKTKRFYSYQSIYGPIGFFARDRQGLFDYRLEGTDKVNGIKAWVLEVKPKSGDRNLPSGKAWVGQDSGQILKIEMDAQALAGYAKARESYDQSGVRPDFRTEHLYEVEKNGILFPSRTVFKESMRTSLGRRVQIAKTEIDFANYRFFTVQSEAVIKQ